MGEWDALFALTGDLAKATGRDAYLLDGWGQVMCKNGEAAWGLAEGELAAQPLTVGGKALGQIGVSAWGLSAAHRQALTTTVRAYALLAALEGAGPRSDSLFEGIRDYVVGHISEDLSGEALAAALYVSRSTVARAVKAGSGLPLRLYIQSVRLDAAQALLMKEGLSVTQVAEQCGVSDFNYFSRIYKKRFGQTPTQTRAQGRA